MPAAEAPPHLITYTLDTQSGALYRTQMQAGAAGRNRSLPQERTALARLEVQAGQQAWPARGQIRRRPFGLRRSAAGEAKAPSHVRHSRAPVPPLFRGGDARDELDRRQPAEASRSAARQ